MTLFTKLINAVGGSQSSSTEIDVETLKAELDAGATYTLVDVRSPEEYSAAHIVGAINIPLEQVAGRVQEFANAPNPVMICRSGARSGTACQMARRQVPAVLNLVGGTEAWRAAGYPVDTNS